MGRVWVVGGDIGAPDGLQRHPAARSRESEEARAFVPEAWRRRASHRAVSGGWCVEALWPKARAAAWRV